MPVRCGLLPTSQSLHLVLISSFPLLCFHPLHAVFPCDTGVSGPAALKLSAFGARVLNEGGYRGKLVVNWLAGNNASKVRGAAYTTAVDTKCMRRLAGGRSCTLPDRGYVDTNAVCHTAFLS